MLVNLPEDLANSIRRFTDNEEEFVKEAVIEYLIRKNKADEQ